MQIDSKKHENPTDANNVLVVVAESFIEWRDKLHKEMRGGKLMFDVPKHYKWLDESELFTYWMNVSSSGFVSGCCEGEKCSVCGNPATNKLEETIFHDDPYPMRHPLTAYVCKEHFRMIAR